MSPAKLCLIHKKPFPCGKCRKASAQKPPQRPVAVAAQKPQKRVLVEQLYCMSHAKPHPCPRCIENEVFMRRWDEQNRLAALINETLRKDWADVAKTQNVKRVPPVGDWHALDASYDPKKYLREINTGLRYAKQVLKDFANSWKGFDDLRQIVDIEIWLATRRYKDEMNGAIAYTIAKNQAKRFLKNQIEEQTVALENPDGTAVMDEFGKPKRIPRSLSFDDKGKDEEGQPRETSVVEEKLSVENGQTIEKAIIAEDEKRLLVKLVSGWFGAKRLVGEALLKDPDSTVRDIPGVPKSTAARVRKSVLAEFRAALQQPASFREVGQVSAAGT